MGQIKSEGKFICQVVRPGEWIAKTRTGSLYIQIPLVVVDDSSEHGSTCRHSAFLTDKTFERTTKTLRECFGWNGSPDVAEFEKFVGMEVLAVVEKDDKYYNVRYLNPVGSKPVAASKDELDKVFAEFGPMIKEIIESPDENEAQEQKSAPAPKPQPQRPYRTKNEADDDIPF